MPRSRTLLMGLLAANVCLAFAMIALQEPQSLSTATLPPVNGDIQLLAEAPLLLEKNLPPPISNPRECRTWGPQANPERFADLIEQLDAEGGFPEVQTQEIQGSPDYLVYVGDLGSREKARRVARELRSLKIDSYVINRDDGTPIISVGLFSREKLAQSQLDKVSKLGYAGFLEEIPRAQTVYNLTAHVAVDSDLHKSSTSACLAFAQNL